MTFIELFQGRSGSRLTVGLALIMALEGVRSICICKDLPAIIAVNGQSMALLQVRFDVVDLDPSRSQAGASVVSVRVMLIEGACESLGFDARIFAEVEVLRSLTAAFLIVVHLLGFVAVFPTCRLYSAT